MHSHEGIEDVEKVADVVENHPGGVEHVVQLPEDHPAGDTDEVVEDGHVDDAQPLGRGEVELFVTESECQTTQGSPSPCRELFRGVATPAILCFKP